MRKKGLAMAVIVTLTAGLLTGCGGDGQYRYGMKPDVVNFQDEAQEMITMCGLTPEDVAMINLTGDPFTKDALGLTCPGIHALLADYHTRGVIQRMSMFYNPALSGSMPSPVGIRYAAISTTTYSFYKDKGIVGLPDSVFVDVGAMNVSYGDKSYPNTTHMSSPLTGDGLASFQDALATTTTWGDPWTEMATTDRDMFDWEIAVITSDWQLYRWRGYWQDWDGNLSTIPPGLTDIYDAFWALTR